jgi:serine/threonine protein phosphatase PrpC
MLAEASARAASRPVPSAPVTTLSLACAVRTDVGPVRGNNEDAVYASPRLAVVADGVGGAAAGEVASRVAIDALAQLDKTRLDRPLADALAEAVATGNARIGFIAECRPQTAGMSTTLTAVALGDEGYVLANVGDSRTYLLRDGAFARLSRDDSYVQMLLDNGVIDPDEARHHPQRSLVLEALDGDPARRGPVVTTAPARAGDRLLLCSDGLSDYVDDDAIAAVLREGGREDVAERLVAMALAAGARDNVSVVVADVEPRRDASTTWA